jgi:hypothetical protein
MNFILSLWFSYAQRLDFIVDIAYTHGDYFRMETIKEIYVQYIFIFGVPTIYIL